MNQFLYISSLSSTFMSSLITFLIFFLFLQLEAEAKPLLVLTLLSFAKLHVWIYILVSNPQNQTYVRS